MKVLLVEDDLTQVDEVKDKIMQVLGPKTHICGPYDDFQQVLPHIEKKDVDLALIDIQLRDDRYAGIHIAEMVQRFLSIPVIFISGITDKVIVQKADNVKSSDFLQKPFDLESLERALGRAQDKTVTPFSGDFKVTFRPRGKDKYWIKTDRSTHVAANPGDIICVEAMDQYCRFYILNEKPLTAKVNLKAEVLDNGLSSYGHFFSLNRSLVVNKNYVDRVLGNQLKLKGLQPVDLKRLEQKLLTIPKDKRREIFAQLGIDI